MARESLYVPRFRHISVGSSYFCRLAGLSGFAIFVAVAGIVLSLFMLLIPVIYEKYDRFNRLARALKEVRVNFILSGTATAVSLLIAYVFFLFKRLQCD